MGEVLDVDYLFKVSHLEGEQEKSNIFKELWGIEEGLKANGKRLLGKTI